MKFDTSKIEFAVSIIYNDTRILLDGHTEDEIHKKVDRIFETRGLVAVIPGHLYSNNDTSTVEETFFAFKDAVLSLSKDEEVRKYIYTDNVYTSRKRFLDRESVGYEYFDNRNFNSPDMNMDACDERYLQRICVDFIDDLDKKQLMKARNEVAKIILEYGFQILYDYDEGYGVVYAEPLKEYYGSADEKADFDDVMANKADDIRREIVNVNSKLLQYIDSLTIMHEVGEGADATSMFYGMSDYEEREIMRKFPHLSDKVYYGDRY